MSAAIPTLEEWLARRNRALEALDMDYARELLPNATSDEVRLTALHKARYECTGIAAELRHESERWLKDNGYTRIHGLPWPKDGLPK